MAGEKFNIGGFRPGARDGKADPDLLLRRAVETHQAGRLGEAIGLYRRILADYPHTVPALVYCGAALLERRRPDDAIELLQRAVFADPKNADALSYLGNAQQMAGRHAAAEKSYRRALAAEPGNAQAHNNLGVVLQRQGRDADAAEAYRKAVERDPAYPQAWNNLAQALVKLGQTDEAIAAARRAVAIAPDYVEAENTLGSALSRAGRAEEAAAAYARALKLKPDFLPALRNLAVAEIVVGRPAAALEACDRALAIEPGSVSVLASKAVALTEAGEHTAQAALVDLERYVRPATIAPPEGYDDVAAFNDALVEHVRAHPTLTYEPAGNATRLGRHTGELTTGPKGPIAALEEAIHAAVADYRAALPDDPDHPVVGTAPSDWRLSIWSVILTEAGHQAPHIHEQGWLSGVYYARVPDAIGVSPEDPAGWIEFGQPQEVYHARHAPPLRLVRPEEGLMVLFPSYFFHRTVPTGSTELRVSVAFDVIRNG